MTLSSPAPVGTTGAGPLITLCRPDDPRVRLLVRALDLDLDARCPEEPCCGGGRVEPGIRFLLAEADGIPVGCCAVQPFPHPDTAAELKRMYVAPEARGRDVAARLLAEAERLAAGLGHDAIRLETGVRQPEAIALYTRAGYRPIPNYPPYEALQLSVCYAKPLPLPEAHAGDLPALTAFLTAQGLLVPGALAAGARYWLATDLAGPALSTGLEFQGPAALLRSVAVRPDLRGTGAARRLIERVLAAAADAGVRTVYLFSTGAGPFWERQGFHEVPVDEAAVALSDTPQVRRFREAGTLVDEVAWRRGI